MPRRRYYGKVQREAQPRRNEEIRLSPLRVIGPDGKQVGVIDRHEALSMAKEHELDLVEVKADVRPPICKIMDYGKYKYELSKKKSARPKKQQEVKEVRLGRSVKIDQHDIGVRLAQARKFLLEGNKVVVVQRFRGREMAHPELGEVRLKMIAEKLSDVARLGRPPQMTGRQMSMLLEPRIEQITAAKPKAESSGDSEPPKKAAPKAASKTAEKPAAKAPVKKAPVAEAAVAEAAVAEATVVETPVVEAPVAEPAAKAAEAKE